MYLTWSIIEFVGDAWHSPLTVGWSSMLASQLSSFLLNPKRFTSSICLSALGNESHSLGPRYKTLSLLSSVYGTILPRSGDWCASLSLDSTELLFLGWIKFCSGSRSCNAIQIWQALSQYPSGWWQRRSVFFHPQVATSHVVCFHPQVVTTPRSRYPIGGAEQSDS
jgi:hypothetical protein